MRGSDEWSEYLRELGLPDEAGWEEIQARYRRLVLSLHPDVNPSRSAAERFRRIALAYERLNTLRLERRSRSLEELAGMCEDPKIRQLPPGELGMRLRYSSSANLRAAAACLLGSLGTKEARRFLLPARWDPDDTVRRVAIESLARAGGLKDLLCFLPFLNRCLLPTYLRSLGCLGVRALNRITRGIGHGNSRGRAGSFIRGG